MEIISTVENIEELELPLIVEPNTPPAQLPGAADLSEAGSSTNREPQQEAAGSSTGARRHKAPAEKPQQEAQAGGTGSQEFHGPRHLAHEGPPAAGSLLSPVHRTLALESIEFDPSQPRGNARAALDQLAASMHQNGLLQPIVVVGWPASSGARYHRVVAGERRVRAARLLGWTEIDALVVDSRTPRFQLSVTENVQRQGLSRADRKHAFERILEGCGGDRKAAAALVGVSLTTFYRTTSDRSADRYANWSPGGALKRLEVALDRMPPKKRRMIAAELRLMADRVELDFVSEE